MHQDLLQIGEVIGIHGMEGELKVRPFTESPKNFENFDKVIIKDKELEIRKSRVYRDKVFLSLERVTKRTTAEKLIGEKIYINRYQVDELQEDEFFIVDLIGAAVLDMETGANLGQLIDVKQTGVVDNFEIKLDQKTILVPALKEYFEIINLNEIRAKIPKEFFDL